MKELSFQGKKPEENNPKPKCVSSRLYHLLVLKNVFLTIASHFLLISAFSIFAFVEYLVAAANMYYYWTIVCDLPTEDIVVMKPPQRAQKLTAAADTTAINGHAIGKGEEDEGMNMKPQEQKKLD